MSQQALASKDAQQFAVIAGGANGLLDALADNLAGDQLSWTDLSRVKVPSGGSTTWQVPTLEGTDSAAQIEGVIVHWQMMRSFWESFDPVAGTPPDCASEDNVVGNGAFGVGSAANPSGRCDRCPMAQWDTGKNGIGQHCKTKRLLFIVRATDLLPIVIATPPGSLKSLKQYFLQLAGAALPYYSVVTKFRLEREKSKGGIDYARIVPQLAWRLPPDQIEAVKAYGEQLRLAVKGAIYEGEAWREDEDTA